MTSPEIWLQIKIDFTLLIYRPYLMSKDKSNLISLYNLMAFFAPLLALAKTRERTRCIFLYCNKVQFRKIVETYRKVVLGIASIVV